MIDDADTRHCWWWMTPAAGRSVQSTDCCFFLFGLAVYKAVPPDSLITPFILKNPKTRWNQSNKCLKWRLSVNFFCTSETSTSELPFRGDQPYRRINGLRGNCWNYCTLSGVIYISWIIWGLTGPLFDVEVSALQSLASICNSVYRMLGKRL